MSSIYARGALWRRWDLHIHTPESIEQDYGGPQSWPQFIQALEALPSTVRVVGITDYYFIDGYERVVKEKLKNGKLENLKKIFPILEFRIDTFASASESKLQRVSFRRSICTYYLTLTSQISIRTLKQYVKSSLSKYTYLSRTRRFH